MRTTERTRVQVAPGLLELAAVTLPTGWLKPPIRPPSRPEHVFHHPGVRAPWLSIRIELPQPQLVLGEWRRRRRPLWRLGRSTADSVPRCCARIKHASRDKRGVTHAWRRARRRRKHVTHTPERLIRHKERTINGSPPLRFYGRRNQGIIDRDQDVCAPIVYLAVALVADVDCRFRRRREIEGGGSPFKGILECGQTLRALQSRGVLSLLPSQSLLPVKRLDPISDGIENRTRFLPWHLSHRNPPSFRVNSVPPNSWAPTSQSSHRSCIQSRTKKEQFSADSALRRFEAPLDLVPVVNSPQ